MHVWNLLGGYELERLPVVAAIEPIDDPEAILAGLAVIRDTMK